MSNLPIADRSGRIPVSTGSGVIYSADPATTPAVDFVVTDTINNNLTTVLTLDHETTGTPTGGIGTRLDFNTENSARSSIVAGSVAVRLTTVSAATPVGKFEAATVGNDGSGVFANRNVFTATYSGGGANYVFGVNDAVSGAIPVSFNVIGASALGGSGNSGAAGVIRGGTGDGVGHGGDMIYSSGISGGNARGSDAFLMSTNSGGGDNRGGDTGVLASDGTGTGRAGTIVVRAGSTDTGVPGSVYVQAGSNGAGSNGSINFSIFNAAATPQLLPRADGEGALGATAQRWGAIRAISGFRRSLVFGLASMNPAGGSNDPLGYGSSAAAALFGYVMLRNGFLTGISGVLTAAPASNVVMNVYLNGASIGPFVVSITGGGGVNNAHATPTPVAVSAGDIVEIRYTSAAGDSALGIAACVEIED